MKKISKLLAYMFLILCLSNAPINALDESKLEIKEINWIISYDKSSIDYNTKVIPLKFEDTYYIEKWQENIFIKTYIVNIKQNIIKNKYISIPYYKKEKLDKNNNKKNTYNFELSFDRNTLEKWLNKYIILTLKWDEIYQKQFEVFIPERFSPLDIKNFTDKIEIKTTSTVPEVQKDYFSYNKFYIFDLKMEEDIVNNYKVYLLANTWNDFLKQEIFDEYNIKDIDNYIYNFSILIESNNRWKADKANFKTKNWDKIEAINLSNWNFAFLINNFFDTPSELNPWTFSYYKSNNLVLSEKTNIKTDRKKEKTITFLKTSLYSDSDSNKKTKQIIFNSAIEEKISTKFESVYLSISEDFTINKRSEQMLWVIKEKIKNFGDYIYYKKNNSAYSDDETIQTFIDRSWNKINSIPWINPPQNIKIWDLEYNFDTISFTYSNYIDKEKISDINTSQNNLILWDEWFEKISELEDDFFEKNKTIYKVLVIYDKNLDIAYRYILK